MLKTMWYNPFFILCCVMQTVVLALADDTPPPSPSIIDGPIRYNTYQQAGGQHNTKPHSIEEPKNNAVHKTQQQAAHVGGLGHPQVPHDASSSPSVPSHGLPASQAVSPHTGSGGQSVHLEQHVHRSSFNLLSEAMSQAVSNEFNSMGSGSASADGACNADDFDCFNGNVQDRFGMEAIASLHRQLDDDDNGNIDLSESDDFLREELKYDSGYEKRQKAFHFNDDMHISVKELWEAWLRSEVHNWTIEQTTDWLAQSVQLPQYVELFKAHKVTGAALPRLAVNNLHYVSNVLGIKDPIHKQKISLKAMDVVLFGPPRESGTRWKDYILVTLLLSAIIGCWYAYQQNKNAKRHLRRMAQDMEGLQRAEQSLQEMQKELERARMEQENVATEKMDLERRLKEAPSLSSSSSDLEVQQLKKEIEMLRNELSRAEFELVDNCWAPPPQLQSWLQYTYELESKNHQKKRISAEKQLQSAREACEKLRKKRSSLVGAFVSTHGKSIDDVDRSIVEARNALGEVTNELQERLHRWKQIETCLGLNIVNNNGLSYLESVLYGRNGGSVQSSTGTGSSKGSRARITSSTDDLDDESVQGMFESYSRSSANASGHLSSNTSAIRDDSSCSEDGTDTQSVQFYLGSSIAPPDRTRNFNQPAAMDTINIGNHNGQVAGTGTSSTPLISADEGIARTLGHNNNTSAAALLTESNILGVDIGGCDSTCNASFLEHSVTVPPRTKKQGLSITPPCTTTQQLPSSPSASSNACLIGRTPLPPPRKALQSQMVRSQSTDMVPMEVYTYLSMPHLTAGNVTNSTATAVSRSADPENVTSSPEFIIGGGRKVIAAPSTNDRTPEKTIAVKELSLDSGTRRKMVMQLSNASQQSTSSTSSSVQSAPSNADFYRLPRHSAGSQQHSPARWSSHERLPGMQSLGGFETIYSSIGNIHQGLEGPTGPIPYATISLKPQANLPSEATNHPLIPGINVAIKSNSSEPTDLTSNASQVVKKHHKRRIRFPFTSSKSSADDETLIKESVKKK
ncbi:stromal interaction molecule homolog isoform X1 [Drosophila tropicalis]|uniref:stromal interaction molecule homolog isoform X1 n=1 Tax=Drosophila tropicalis TaxID=46794 RepID=UPI0035AC186F